MHARMQEACSVPSSPPRVTAVLEVFCAKATTRPFATRPPFFHPRPFPTYLPQLSRSIRGVPRSPRGHRARSSRCRSPRAMRVGTFKLVPAKPRPNCFCSVYVAQRGRNMQGLLDHLVLGVLRVRPVSHLSASRLKCVRI